MGWPQRGAETVGWQVWVKLAVPPQAPKQGESAFGQVSVCQPLACVGTSPTASTFGGPAWDSGPKQII